MNKRIKKTPQSSSKTPQSSVEKKTASEKKLIQARLPFKVLSTTTSSTEKITAATSSSATNESRKRKLSYSSEETVPTPKQTKKLVISSTLKENLNSKDSESIVISDDESPISDHNEDEIDQRNSSTNSVDDKLNVESAASLQIKSSSKDNKKLTIKLPLTHKRRKKSKSIIRNKLEESESSDPELVIEERKRLKKTKITIEDEDFCSSLVTVVAKSVDVEEKLDEKSEKEIVNDGKLKNNIKENKIDKTETVNVLNTNNKELKTNSNEADVEEITSNNCTTKTLRDKKNDEIVLKEEKTEVIENENKQNVLELLNESDNEETLSPKLENKSINETISSPSVNTKNLTPTSLKKKDDRNNKSELEKQKRKEIEEQKRKEKEEQRRKEKEEKEELKRKEKQEKEDLKRKEREEKEELKRKEKEEKEKKRLLELEMKNEEKRKKDEQKEEERKKRDDEKRKKELEKEEAELKKKKAAQAFTNFFRTKKTDLTKINKTDEEQTSDSATTNQFENHAFMPFQIKGDMKLAPLIRKTLNADSKKNLEEIIINEKLFENELYLNLLRTGKYAAYKLDKIKEDNDSNDVIFIEDDLLEVGQSINETSKSVEIYKAKYFNFHENRRPPYYGTWRKKSNIIGPRKPFSHDKIHFDYDVDSDDEWEEEEPGESLHGSDDEKESEDEYEVDNEFFVPHGHLSDEEIQNEDETDDDNSPECQKAKLKILQQEFANEMKKKTEKIRPRLIGIVWVDENGNQPKSCPNVIWESLNKCAMIPCCDLPLKIEPDNINMEAGPPILQDNKRTIRRNEFPEQYIVDLIRLVHGNRHKKKFLITEFQEFIAEKFKLQQEQPIEYSKAVIKEKIDKISKWQVIDDLESKNKKKKLCWIVSSEILRMHNMENISLINSWNYILPPAKWLIKNIVENANDKTIDQKSNTKNSSDIKLFAKVLTKDEKFMMTNENNTNCADVVENNTSISGIITEFISNQTDNMNTKFDKTVIHENINTDCKPPQIVPVKPVEKLITNQNTTNANLINSTVIPEKVIAKKRVPILMSVPIGQEIPETYKNQLFKPSEIVAVKPVEKLITNPSTTNTNLINSPVVSDNVIVKKRVPLLMSVPRGQAISETYKNELINNFLKKGKEKCTETKNTLETQETTTTTTTTNLCPNDTDSVILIN